MHKAGSSIDSIKHRVDDWSASTSDSDAIELIQTQQLYANKAAALHLAGLDGFTGFNPYLPQSNSQGLLECLFEVQQISCSMTGLKSASLAATSNSQAVFACLSMIKKYHHRKKQMRKKVLLCADLPEVVSNARRVMLEIEKVDIGQLEQSLDSDVAAIVVDVPKPGLQEFLADSVLAKIREMDVLIYLEGSGQYFYPLPLMPNNFTVDLFNLDLGYLCETEAGAYAVLSSDTLQAYLPVPRVQQKDKQFELQSHRQNPFSIGPLTTAAANIEMILRCYVQLRLNGDKGIQQQALKAIVSALYVDKKISESGNQQACSIIPSSGLCRIELRDVESSIELLERQLQQYQASGVRVQGRLEVDKSPYTMTLGRLHYLSRKQLDAVIELIISKF